MDIVLSLFKSKVEDNIIAKNIIKLIKSGNTCHQRTITSIKAIIENTIFNKSFDQCYTDTYSNMMGNVTQSSTSKISVNIVMAASTISYNSSCFF